MLSCFAGCTVLGLSTACIGWCGNKASRCLVALFGPRAVSAMDENAKEEIVQQLLGATQNKIRITRKLRNDKQECKPGFRWYDKRTNEEWMNFAEEGEFDRFSSAVECDICFMCGYENGSHNYTPAKSDPYQNLVPDILRSDTTRFRNANRLCEECNRWAGLTATIDNVVWNIFRNKGKNQCMWKNCRFDKCGKGSHGCDACTLHLDHLYEDFVGDSWDTARRISGTPGRTQRKP